MAASVDDTVARLGAFQHIERAKGVEAFEQLARTGVPNTLKNCTFCVQPQDLMAHTTIDSDGWHPDGWHPCSHSTRFITWSTAGQLQAEWPTIKSALYRLQVAAAWESRLGALLGAKVSNTVA